MQKTYHRQNNLKKQNHYYKARKIKTVVLTKAWTREREQHSKYRNRHTHTQPTDF